MAAKPIKVTVRETPELHDFRARYAQLIRKLPKKWQSTMFAHVIMVDIHDLTWRYSKTLMVAYSEKIAPRYKMPVAGMHDIKRYNPELIAAGLITRELEHFTDWDSKGNLRHRQINRYWVSVDTLETLTQPAVPAKSEPMTAPTTAPTTAPHIVSKETVNRSSGTEIRLTPVHHHPRDDDATAARGANRAKASTRSSSTRASGVPGEDVTEFEAGITEAIGAWDWGRPDQPPFTVSMLGRDRDRVLDMIVRLHGEEPFTADELVVGMIRDGMHNPEGIRKAAGWVNTRLRGADDATVRGWVKIGREWLAELAEEDAREERERAELPGRIISSMAGRGPMSTWTVSMDLSVSHDAVCSVLASLYSGKHVQRHEEQHDLYKVTDDDLQEYQRATAGRNHTDPGGR